MTVDGGPGWQLPLESSLTSDLGPLRAVLCTTFDPPDPDILIEDILPRWLGVTRDLVDSGPARKTFLVELQLRLKALRGKIAIFSSAGAIAPHWLWRDLHICQVGSDRNAVQHSKLWLLHRGPSAETKKSTLEIVISSTNLTRPSLQKQIQAGWRAVVNLEKPASSRLSTWGVLPEFIAEIGRQSGEKGREAVRYWLDEVFPRAKCPDVTFIASVPGRYSRATLRRAKTSWGISGIRNLRPVARNRRITIVAPSIGSFDTKGIRKWADAAGSSANRMTLAWIPKGHAWSRQGWSMPVKTVEALREAQVSVKEFPDPEYEAIEEFHEEWDRTRDRWVHGKLYWLQDGHRRRLLVTSANWSQAAWGTPTSDGGLMIDNFELGVAFDCAWNPLHDAPPLEDEIASEEPKSQDPPPIVSWCEGLWDGKTLRLAVRLSGEKHRIASSVDVMCRGKELTRTIRWSTKQATTFQGMLFWGFAQGVPAAVRARTSGEKVEVFEIVVSDIRPRRVDTQEEFESIDSQEAEILELRLLEERYGGPSADDNGPGPEEDPEPPDGDGGSGREREKADIYSGGSEDEVDVIVAAQSANYEVPAIARAREKLAIVTNWAETLANMTSDDTDGASAVIEDGRRLLELWRGQYGGLVGVNKLAVRVAIGELVVRLRSCT